MPVYQRRDGATIKPGYHVKRTKGDETIFVVKHITTRKDLARVTLLLVPHEVFTKTGEQLEKVCKIDDVCCVRGRHTEALVTMARDNMARKNMARVKMTDKDLAKEISRLWFKVF